MPLCILAYDLCLNRRSAADRTWSDCRRVAGRHFDLYFQCDADVGLSVCLHDLVLLEESGTLRDFKRDLEPSFRGLPEMGWIFSPSVHGKGYASEAVRAALEWGKPRFAPKKPVCLIAPENAPSIRLAERHGFREFQRSTYKGLPAILFRHEAI